MTQDDFDADELLQMEQKLWAWADQAGHAEVLGDAAIGKLAALILGEVRQAVGLPPRREQPAEQCQEPDDDGVPF